MLSPRTREMVVALWVLLLVTLLLGPVLWPGYLLTYDMVWVPNLSLTADSIGLGSALPRAVPSDAVIAVLDQVIPGMWLQKIVLLGALVSGGVGIARLLPDKALLGRLVAAAAYVWNPLAVERLVLGHWPLLVAIGTAPWILDAAHQWGRGRPPRRLWWLLPLGSLAASSGLTTALLLCTVSARRRRMAPLAVLVITANLPWLAAGALHAGIATTDPASAGRFALHDEGSVPGPVAALTLGGVWNAEVVPDARLGVVGWVAPVVLVALAVAGLRPLRHYFGRHTSGALLVCWFIGWAGASLTWVAPQLTAAFISQVPGGGVLRDGSRLLVLTAPLLCLAVGWGAHRLAAAVSHPARSGVAIGLAFVPLALLPGVAWGAGAGLRAVDYPEDYRVARETLQSQEDGDLVVLLPFDSYRAPTWNGSRKVLDPTGRYLTAPSVQNDELVVNGQSLAGEDPVARKVGRALGQPTPKARRAALLDLGVSVVITDLDARPAPTVEGTTVVAGDVLEVKRLGPASQPAEVPHWWIFVMAPAWLVSVGAPLTVLIRWVLTQSRPFVRSAQVRKQSRT